MQFFFAAYALAFLVWRAQDHQHPWLLLFVLIAVSVWLVLYLCHRRRGIH